MYQPEYESMSNRMQKGLKGSGRQRSMHVSSDRPLSICWVCAQGAKDFLGGMGLGLLADQLGDLRLGELLDTPPPGLDEAVAIAKVCSQHAGPGMSAAAVHARPSTPA